MRAYRDMMAEIKDLDTKLTEVTNSTNMPATNLVTNGSFNTKANWVSGGVAGTGGGSSIDSNKFLYGETSLKIVNNNGARREKQDINTIVGHKYYQRASAYINSFTNGYAIFGGIASALYFDTTKIGQWQTVSNIREATDTSYTIYVGTVNYSTFDINFDGVLILDLTEIFGAGNEPSLKTMDDMFNEIGYFEGTKNPLLSLRQLIGYLNNMQESLGSAIAINNVGYIDNPLPADWTGQAMVTLSYDDGVRSIFYRALPLHEKHGIPATFNVISSRFAHPSSFDQAMTKECWQRGVEIASHSHYHDEQLTTKTDEELHFEFSESKRLLNEAIGAEVVDTIAIPFSAYDERVRSIAMQYYKGVRVYSNLQNDIPPTDRYWLYSRIAVDNTTTFEQVKARIDEAVSQKKWCIIMLHGINNDEVKGQYEISQKLLDQILSYINSFGRDVLLPINTKDALKFSLGEDY